MNHKSLVTGLGLLVCIAGASGCVLQRDHEAYAAKVDKSEKDLQQARNELAQMRTDLDATRQRLDNALRANADSNTDVLSTKARLNDLAGRLDETQHGIEDLRRDVTASRTELYARIDDLKRAQPAAVAPPPPQATVPGDKNAHFAALKEAHGKRDWSMVRTLGPEYLNRYPSDEHADEALYFAGNADLLDGRPTSALGNFNRLLKLFPRSKMLDKTLFEMGEAYLLLHDCTNAKLAYQACESRFSKEKIGADAKAKLAQIAKNPPGLCAP